MDLAQLATISGPIFVAILGAARFLGPKIITLYERHLVELRSIEDRKAVALERVVSQQGEMLVEMKLTNERLGAVEAVVVDKRFSDVGALLQKLLGQQKVIAAAVDAEQPPSDPPPADHADPAPAPTMPTATAVTITIGAPAGTVVAAGPPSASPAPQAAAKP